MVKQSSKGETIYGCPGNINERQQEKMSTLLWHVEGIKNAMQMIPENSWDYYDAVILTGTFLTQDWHIDSFYAVHKVYSGSLKEAYHYS